MEDDHQELYLQKLQEFICDEDKIVTYTWLSKKLQLPVKECKELLEQFVKDYGSSKTGELGVTYVILGKLKDDGTDAVAIVKESDLSEKKLLFDSVKSESIYSVQKAKDVNLNVVCMIDMFDTASPQLKPLLGSVVSKNSVKRNVKEKKPLPVLNRAAPTDKSKASHLFGKASDVKKEVKQTSQATVKKEQNEGKHENKATTPSKASGTNKPKQSQKNALAGMFAKMPPKSETKPSAEVKKESDGNDTVEVREGGKAKAKNGTESPNKKCTFYDSGSDEEARKIEESNKSKKPASQKKQAKKGTSKKRQKESDESERPQKRRKRIVERNDSDSDDIFGDENDENEENVVKMSDDDEPVLKRTAPFPDDAPKNKQRKLVDKTYEDEEGYIVTVQEMVTVSESEEESEPEKPKPEQKKESPPVTIKKPVPAVKEAPAAKPGKGKKAAKPTTNQPTLMSFFSKK